MQRNKGYRKSYGIILCRKNRTSGDYEFLLVRRRYTYAFCDFICAKYMRDPPYHRKQSILRMFEKMTVNEFIDILSYDFDKIWHKLWLDGYPEELYNDKKTIFYENFKSADDIKEFIPKIRRSGEDLWGLPKGRANIGEPGEICAIREMEEETGIDKKSYNIIATPTVRSSHTGDDGISYYNEFFIAIANSILSCQKVIPFKLGISSISIKEIDDIKWMSINKITTLDNSGIILPIVRQAVAYIRKFSRGEYMDKPKRDRHFGIQNHKKQAEQENIVCHWNCEDNFAYPLIEYVRRYAVIESTIGDINFQRMIGVKCV